MHELDVNRWDLAKILAGHFDPHGENRLSVEASSKIEEVTVGVGDDTQEVWYVSRGYLGDVVYTRYRWWVERVIVGATDQQNVCYLSTPMSLGMMPHAYHLKDHVRELLRKTDETPKF